MGRLIDLAKAAARDGVRGESEGGPVSCLDRLKDKFPENCPTEVLTKLTEAPFVSSVSTRVGQNFKNALADTALALTGVFVEWSAARGVTYRRLGPLPKVPAELHERVIITVGERSFESGHVSGGLTLVEWQARVLMAYGATASVRGVGP